MMASEKTRLAVIHSQQTFEASLDVEDRTGNEHDVKELESTLEKLGFSVRSFKDLKRQDILSSLKGISLEEIKNLECILVTVLTHGDSGGVLLAKDQEFYTKEVWEPFRDSEKLNKVPKIFIFQACRGKKEEETFSFQIPKEGPQNCVASQTVPILPHKPGFLLIHSTIADHVSKRCHNTGTIFIQTLCDELSAAHDQNGTINFLSLLTEVNDKVITAAERDNGSQTSTFTSFMRHPLILKTKNSNDDQKSSSKTPKSSNDAAIGSVRKAYEDVGTKLILILYTQMYEDEFQELKLVLDQSHFKIQSILVNDIEVIYGLSRCTDFKNVGSLTVIVLAEIWETAVTDYCEKLFVTFSTLGVPLNAVWSQFTVSHCHELMGKPKLFFFCDLLKRKDNLEKNTYQRFENDGNVNNHSDFIWTYCYGKRMFDEVKFALCSSQEKVTHLLTTAMRKSDVTPSTRISHFESTLRLQFYYHTPPQEKTSLHPQEAILAREIEPHVKVTTSEGTPIEPVAGSFKNSYDSRKKVKEMRTILYAMRYDSALEDTLDDVRTLNLTTNQNTLKKLKLTLLETVKKMKHLNLHASELNDVQLERESYVKEIEQELNKLATFMSQSTIKILQRNQEIIENLKQSNKNTEEMVKRNQEIIENLKQSNKNTKEMVKSSSDHEDK